MHSLSFSSSRQILFFFKLFKHKRQSFFNFTFSDVLYADKTIDRENNWQINLLLMNAAIYITNE